MALVTDSTADLTPAEWAELKVSVVGLTLEVGGTLFSDPGTVRRPDLPVLDPATLVRRMEEGAAPRTSQAVPGDFRQAYAEALEAGAERVLCFPVASHLSGTFASAVTAAEEFRDRVEVVDTRTLSVGLGAAVRQARVWLDRGTDPGEVARRLTGFGGRVFLRFVPGSLRWLVAGGRLSRVAGAAAGLLNVHPVIRAEAGKVEAAARIRGFHAALRELARSFPEGLEATVLHAGNLEGARTLTGELALRNVRVRATREIPAVLLVHAGPGTVGLVGVPPLESA